MRFYPYSSLSWFKEAGGVCKRYATAKESYVKNTWLIKSARFIIKEMR